MKKILSVLLVALMLVGLLPMNAIHTHAAANLVKATSIAVGDQVVFVCESKGYEMTSVGSSYGNGTKYSTTPAGTMLFNVVAGSAAGSVAFENNGKYLSWSGGNNLYHTATSVNANASWNVTFDTSENAKVANVNTSSRVLQWNASSPRFACYTSTQTPIQLYKVEKAGSGETYNVSFSVPEGVSAIEDMACTSAGITLPSAGVPTGDHTYTFAGWTTDKVDNDTNKPTIYKAGENYKASEETTLYAVYTYVVGGNSGSTATKYVLTDASDIKPEDTVVIATSKDNKYHAMSNGNGTSSAPSAVAVTVSNGVLSEEPAENLKWDIGGSKDAYIFYPSGTTAKWLYCTSTNNGVRVGTNTANAFKIDATSGYLYHNGTNRYIGIYNNADWRCYTSVNTNIAGQTLCFFVETTGAGGTTYYTTVISSAPAECEHNYQSVVTAPDCVNGGYTTYTCSACGDTYVADQVAALGHDYEAVVTAPTCGAAGYTTHTCSVCGDNYKDSETPATGDHSFVSGECTVCGASNKQWVLVTDADDIIAGGEFVIVATDAAGNNFALPTAIAGKMNGVAVTVKDGKVLYMEGQTPVWTIENISDNSFAITNGTNYLKYSSSTNLGSNNSAYAWTLEEYDDAFKVVSGTDGRGMVFRSSTYNQFGGYALSNLNGTSREYFGIKFYKLDNQCEHNYERVVTEEPTCTEEGVATYTCELCSDSYTEAIPVLNHNYEAVVTAPDCVNGGYTTHTCSGCGDSYVTDNVAALGHSYRASVEEIDGVPTITNTCDCGDVKTAQLMFVAARLTLENNIVVKFKTAHNVAGSETYTGFSDLYAEFTYGNRTGDNKLVANFSDMEKLSDGAYRIPCRQISPSQIGDEITATLYGTFNGEKYSYEMKYSVAQYCYNMLETSDSEELKTLLTDLLFYCDAARAYTSYQGVGGYTGSVTAGLTQRTDGASYEEGAIANPVGSDCAAPVASWKSASLIITDTTAIQFRVDMGETALTLDMIRATVAGEAYTNIRFRQDGETWLIRVEGLSAHQMRDEVKVQLYDGETAISHTVSYSIVSYANRNNEDAALSAMMRAMINYGDSAVAYKQLSA